jgi:antitoxin VapB
MVKNPLLHSGLQSHADFNGTQGFYGIGHLTCLQEIHIMRHTTSTELANVNQTAKIFTTGRSQAVRLPLEFRFDVAEVFIRHDPLTGDVVLSRKPQDWQGLLDAVARNKDDDVLIERRPTHARRDPFEGWEE